MIFDRKPGKTVKYMNDRPESSSSMKFDISKEINNIHKI
jgi:hypothetical protein